jgi:hypothetical protein
LKDPVPLLPEHFFQLVGPDWLQVGITKKYCPRLLCAGLYGNKKNQDQQDGLSHSLKIDFPGVGTRFMLILMAGWHLVH